MKKQSRRQLRPISALRTTCASSCPKGCAQKPAPTSLVQLQQARESESIGGQQNWSLMRRRSV